MARGIACDLFLPTVYRMIVSAVHRGKYIFRLKDEVLKVLSGNYHRSPRNERLFPIFHKGWNGTLVADYFERTRTNPSLHSLSERKSSWKVSRHRVSILNVNFKHDSNSQILLYLEFQGSFLRRGADDLF